MKKDAKKGQELNEEQDLWYNKVITELTTIPGVVNELDKDLNSSRMGRVGRHTMWQTASN